MAFMRIFGVSQSDNIVSAVAYLKQGELDRWRSHFYDRTRIAAAALAAAAAVWT
jgi:hypothetical protein